MTANETSRNTAKTHIKLVDGLSHLEILNLAFENAVKHVVHRSQTETVRELRSAIMMQQKPETFLKYPLATVLRPSNATAETEKAVTIFERPFSKLDDKEATLSEIAALFEEARINNSLRDDVILTADELICNALFNAPRPDGRNHETLEKMLKEAQNPTREGLVKIGIYNGFLALACEDKYGSLKPLRMLERVHKCLVEGPGSALNVGEHGTAGIGSFMVFSACTSLFMCVQEGVVSQVCAIFPTTQSARARAAKPKNIHWNYF